MITDANLLLAGQHKADGSIEPQTVTAAAVSSNAVDLRRPLDIGQGQPPVGRFQVHTAAAGGHQHGVPDHRRRHDALTTGVQVLGTTGPLVLAQLKAGAPLCLRHQPADCQQREALSGRALRAPGHLHGGRIHGGYWSRNPGRPKSHAERLHRHLRRLGMPRYRVLEKSFIGNRLVQAGEEIDYEGEASSNLEPLDTPVGEPAKEPAEAGKPGGRGARSSAPLV